MFGWSRKSRSSSGFAGAWGYWWLGLIDFRNFFITYVFGSRNPFLAVSHSYCVWVSSKIQVNFRFRRCLRGYIASRLFRIRLFPCSPISYLPIPYSPIPCSPIPWRFRVLLFRVRLFRVCLFRVRLFRVRLFSVRLFRVRLFRVRLFRVRLFRIRIIRVLLYCKPPRIGAGYYKCSDSGQG